jgi:hypothetical protein
LQILYEANTSNDIVVSIFHHPKMGSFGKTALSGQISGFSPQKKWVRLVFSAFEPFAAE